jgi:predicted nuclease of predicted toxin-antitoxin system
MDKVRFLFDECIPATLLEVLLRKEPSIDILSVGEEGAPSKGTLDPVLLEVAASGGRILVTRDKKTMPGHLVDFFQQQKHNAGVIILKPNYAGAKVIEDLFMIWFITSAEEWTDRTEFIPYGTRQ